MAETGTVWSKEGYVLGERDAHGDPLATAIPPGIYCYDEETREDFVARIDTKKVEAKLAAFRGEAPFFGIGGIRIVIATPSQIAWFEAKEALRDGKLQ